MPDLKSNQRLSQILWWALAIMILINVFNVIAGVINVFFIQGSYQQMLGKTFVSHKAEYKKVYESIGASGRIMLTMLMNNCSPICFERIMDKICVELVENHAQSGKRK